MVELSRVGHDEGMNGSLDNKVEPFNNFQFSTSMRSIGLGRQWSDNQKIGRLGFLGTWRRLLEDGPC
jgi:hypothetical protein